MDMFSVTTSVMLTLDYIRVKENITITKKINTSKNKFLLHGAGHYLKS
jgi:hypothetical protein